MTKITATSRETKKKKSDIFDVNIYKKQTNQNQKEC